MPMAASATTLRAGCHHGRLREKRHGDTIRVPDKTKGGAKTGAASSFGRADSARLARTYIYVDVNVNRAMPAVPRSAQRPKDQARTFTITELATEFDITARAIRFYEDVGLLTPERSGRNRVYTQRDRTRLKLTLRGKRLGLSLQEIKQLVEMYDSPSDTAPQLQAFMAVLAEHRVQLEQQREDIEITLAEIAQHEVRCRSLLSAASAKIRRR
jgi:DNA-binding transcriptional MerR regulator